MKITLTNCLAISFIFLLQSFSTYGKELQPTLPPIKLPNNIMAATDISAIAKLDSFLVIGSDEGGGEDGNKNYIQLLSKNLENYQIHNNILLFKGNKSDGKEMDIEGLAVERRTLYVIGSHSLKRKKLKSDSKYEKNRKLFKDKKIKHEKNRDWLYRLKFDATGTEIAKDKITLRTILDNDPVLKTFSHIPGKENGIDIEGIAIKNKWLYIGFRGPVFRENYVPIIKLQFDAPKDTYHLLYVQLGGRGIRDITSVSDGFLILAGSVGNSQNSYQLYHWDGKDMIHGENRKAQDIGNIHLFGNIQTPKNGKAEGLVVTQEDSTSYQLIVAYDGIKTLQRFHITKE